LNNFISVKDAGNINDLIRAALDFKKNPLINQPGTGKRMGLLFLNPSLRTRISTQIAAENLGLKTIIFNASQDGWQLEFNDGAIMNGNTVEHIKDAAPVLGNYFDIIGIRTFPSLKDREEDYNEQVLSAFIKYSGVPIISLETATLHPLQSFADAITISESMEKIINERKLKVVLSWAPHIKALPQCVANSFAQWINAWDKTDLTIACPAGFELDPKFSGDAIITNDQNTALDNADIVYVKNWSSYNNYGQTLTDPSWMLTKEKLKITNNAKVMHCLPVRRNVELSDEILDSEQSLVTKQAANRVWSAQTVISEILKTIS
jgi:N-succinyl-L-ornithine transcarbamylase